MLSVILPVKNEPHLTLFINQINQVLGNLPHEILMQYEDGISNAVWHGINRARGRIIVVLDSDGSHNPNDILKLLHTFKSNDVDIVLGSRKWSQYPLTRRVLSLSCRWLTRKIMGWNLSDPLTGFILARKNTLKFNSGNGCKFLLDIICHTPETRIIEYPILHHYPNGHKSKLKPVEGIYLLEQLWRLWNEHHKQTMA